MAQNHARRAFLSAEHHLARAWRMGGLHPCSQFMFRGILKASLKILLRIVYRIRVLGPENVPAKGGALMIANHVTWLDALIISTACPRPVRFVVLEEFFRVPSLAWFLRLFDSVPISQTQARQAIKTVAEAVKSGSLVCIFPEGMLTRTGLMNELRKGFELIARQAGGAPLIPTYLDNLWGSIFSYADGRFFFKRPRRLPYPVSVGFGAAIGAAEARQETARAALLELGWQAFRERRHWRTTLDDALGKALAQSKSAECLIDRNRFTRTTLTREFALSTAVALAKRWRAVPGRRVGVAVPSGGTAVMAYVGLVLAGKIPVPLPLDLAATEEEESSLARALAEVSLDWAIASDEALLAMPKAPWPENVALVSDELRATDGLPRLAARLRVSLTPRWLLRRQLGLPGHPSKHVREPALAFLDRSADGWRYRFLTHEEVLANVHQVAGANLFQPNELIVVHEDYSGLVGQIFGLWLPLLKHYRPLCHSLSDPVDVLVEEEPVTSAVADETGLAYLAKRPGDEPTGIRQIVTFTPWRATGVCREMEETFGRPVCHGFVSPPAGVILSLSMAHPVDPDGQPTEQTGYKPGARGRLLPGFLVRVDEPDAEGFGELRGRGPTMEEDCSFGVVARIDAEGFLFVKDEG